MSTFPGCLDTGRILFGSCVSIAYPAPKLGHLEARLARPCWVYHSAIYSPVTDGILAAKRLHYWFGVSSLIPAPFMATLGLTRRLPGHASLGAML